MVVFKIPTWNIRQNIGFFCFWKFLTSVMYSCSRFFWYLFLPHTLTRHGLLTGPDHQLPTYRTWSSITYLQDLIINYKLPLQWNSPVPWEKESLQIWSEKSTTVQNGQLTRCNSDNLYPTPPPEKKGWGRERQNSDRKLQFHFCRSETDKSVSSLCPQPVPLSWNTACILIEK